MQRYDYFCKRPGFFNNYSVKRRTFKLLLKKKRIGLYKKLKILGLKLTKSILCKTETFFLGRQSGRKERKDMRILPLRRFTYVRTIRRGKQSRLLLKRYRILLKKAVVNH
jgi:hypothetical protein